MATIKKYKKNKLTPCITFGRADSLCHLFIGGSALAVGVQM